MSNQRQLLQRISTAKNISKITKAMEMVAASKMKKAQEQAIASRPFAKSLEESLKTLSQYTNSDEHPLLSQHSEGIDIALVISTNKGLCGSLNTNLLKRVLSWKSNHTNMKIVAVGKKAVLFSRFSGLDLHAQFTDIPEKASTADILPISSLVIEGFLEKRFRSVHLIYTDFINTLSQVVVTNQLLPLPQPESKSHTDQIKTESFKQYLFEPTAAKILHDLLPYYIENSIFQALLEGKASEHSARMVAMKNASENANELVTELRLAFNKSRQESITSELLDIVSATMSLA